MSEQATMDDLPSGKDNGAKVKRWLSEIDLATKAEKDWRKDAEKALLAYRGQVKVDDSGGTKEVFNILWSNTEIKRQAVYNNPPRSDIRRRHRDKDGVGKAISELLERATSYAIDCQNVDGVLIAAVNDMLLPGRAITRVRYKSETTGEGEEEAIAYEEVIPEQVQYDDFIRGPGKTWGEVRWIAFCHKMRKSEIKTKFPDFAEKIEYDVADTGDGKDLDKTDETVFKRAEIYEIWDKDELKVYWLCKTFKDDFLDVQDDPLEMRDFWPIPEPLYAIESSTSLIPITEYSQYEILAKELEIITRRRNRIASALRVRGVYDSTLAEMGKIFESEDNDFIPAENLSRLIEGGGLEKAIWMLPIEKLVVVFQVLGQQRQELIGQIYEITGISDIVRGDTNPNETLGAQQIKASFGNMRIDRQRRAVEKYARDLIRLMVEVMADKFSPETLEQMTGMDFPTGIEKQMAQQALQAMQVQAQQFQAAQQPMPPQMQQMMQEAQQIASKLSWDEIDAVMKSDVMREYRVDVETDSMIAADLQQDQKNMTDFMNGMGMLFKFSADGINSGMITPEIGKKVMASFVRKFKLGKEVEDELEAMISQPPQQGPNPQQQAEQAKMQGEQQKAQMQMQMLQQKAQAEQAKLQAEVQAAQQQAAIDVQKAQADAQIEKQRLGTEIERLNMSMAEAQAKHAMTMEKIAANGNT